MANNYKSKYKLGLLIRLFFSIGLVIGFNSIPTSLAISIFSGLVFFIIQYLILANETYSFKITRDELVIYNDLKFWISKQSFKNTEITKIEIIQLRTAYREDRIIIKDLKENNNKFKFKGLDNNTIENMIDFLSQNGLEIEYRHGNFNKPEISYFGKRK